jgi:chromosome partitioning protein
VRIIALANEKGGSGKTTTAVNLSACLAEKGKKTLLIDLDPQSASSRWLRKEDQAGQLLDAFTGAVKLSDLVQNVGPSLDIIPSNRRLGTADGVFPFDANPKTIMAKAFASLPRRWDFVLCDCPPNLGVLTLGALSAVQEVLITCEAHYLAMQGLVDLTDTIEKIKGASNPKLKTAGIVVCRADYRTNHTKEIIEQLRGAFGKQVLKSVIRENIRLAECPAYGHHILDYHQYCNGAEDYRSLAKEIIKQDKKRRK